MARLNRASVASALASTDGEAISPTDDIRVNVFAFGYDGERANLAQTPPHSLLESQVSEDPASSWASVSQTSQKGPQGEATGFSFFSVSGSSAAATGGSGVARWDDGNIRR